MTVHEAEIWAHDDIKSLRSEYTRLRDIAQKRLNRLGKSEYARSKTYKNHKDGFKKLRDIADADLAAAFSELSKFVDAKRSTVTGQREWQRKTTKTLNEAVGGARAGQPLVNKKNYWRVIDILDEARKRKRTYGSDKIVSLADATLMLSDDQFDDILDRLDQTIDHVDELEESLEQYMADQGIENYQIVDIPDLYAQTGWK